jgi:hypothetical protein
VKLYLGKLIENVLFGMGSSTPQGGTLYSPHALRGIRTFRQIIFLQKNKKTICKDLTTNPNRKGKKIAIRKQQSCDKGRKNKKRGHHKVPPSSA